MWVWLAAGYRSAGAAGACFRLMLGGLSFFLPSVVFPEDFPDPFPGAIEAGCHRTLFALQRLRDCPVTLALLVPKQQDRSILWLQRGQCLVHIHPHGGLFRRRVNGRFGSVILQRSSEPLLSPQELESLGDRNAVEPSPKGGAAIELVEASERAKRR
jgi:hypothetical protein